MTPIQINNKSSIQYNHIPWILVLALLLINILKFKPKYCFKKILYEDELHFLVSFSFETQFEERLNDPEQVFR